MKKLVFLSTVLTVSVLGANAQVQLGFKAGANFATITDNTGGKLMVNFNAGILAKIPLTEALSLQPEAVYSGQGVKGSGGKISLNYINIPVLLTYTLPEGLFFQTGPQMGFLLSAKAKGDDGTSEDLKPLFSSTDFAWVFGTGFLFPDTNFGLNARYNLGISSLGKDGGSSKNSVFQIGIFLLLRAAGK